MPLTTEQDTQNFDIEVIHGQPLMVFIVVTVARVPS